MELFKKFLKCCQRVGIIISAKKLQTGTSVNYCGFIISSNPDPESASQVGPDMGKVDSFSRIPPPTNKKSLQCFLGVAQSLSQFTVKMQLNRVNLDELLKKDSKFIWDNQHQIDFEMIKKAICNPQRLSAFDPELDTILEVDSPSKSGLNALNRCGLQIAFLIISKSI